MHCMHEAAADAHLSFPLIHQLQVYLVEDAKHAGDAMRRLKESMMVGEGLEGGHST